MIQQSKLSGRVLTPTHTYYESDLYKKQSARDQTRRKSSRQASRFREGSQVRESLNLEGKSSAKKKNGYMVDDINTDVQMEGSSS